MLSIKWTVLKENGDLINLIYNIRRNIDHEIQTFTWKPMAVILWHPLLEVSRDMTPYESQG